MSALPTIHPVTILSSNRAIKVENVRRLDTVEITNGTDGDVQLFFPRGHPFQGPADLEKIQLVKDDIRSYAVRNSVAYDTEYIIYVIGTDASPRIRIITASSSSS